MSMPLNQTPLHCCGMTMGYGIIHKVLLRRTKEPAMTRDNHNSE